jgi:hypothetical protein
VKPIAALYAAGGERRLDCNPKRGARESKLLDLYSGAPFSTKKEGWYALHVC